jgi:hypothetical protein
LYKSLLDRSGRLLTDVNGNSLREENRTLQAVAKLCEARHEDRGVQSVITYNYDNLLECVLKDRGEMSAVPVSGETELLPEHLPIYHVHGILPIHHDQDFEPGAIVFTEEDYHQAADDPYSWSNIVQLQALSNCTNLMVGLSMTDRNMRRLLDAVGRAPVRGSGFVLLRREQFEAPGPEELEKIHERAKQMVSDFEGAGIKRTWGHPEATGEWVESQRLPRKRPMFQGLGMKGDNNYGDEISKILQGVHAIEDEQQVRTLLELGVTPVWFDSFEEIAAFVEKIPAGE